MLFKKLWRTMGQYKAQFISMIIMIVLGVGIFFGFNMEWKTIENSTSKFMFDTNYADFRLTSESGFSTDDVKKIEEISGVDKAGRYISIDVAHGEKKIALSVTENKDVSNFLVVEGEAYDESSQSDIWLAKAYAEKNDIAIGESITLTYGSYTLNLQVKGLIKSSEHMICIRDESQIMPDYSMYGYAYISPATYNHYVGIDFYPQIHVLSVMDKDDFQSAVNSALGKTTLVTDKTQSVSYAGAESETEEGKTLGTILPALFLLIAVLTMVTTMRRLAAKEKTQIGTLKALGFKDRRILFHYSFYALIVGVLGTILGIALGYGIVLLLIRPGTAMYTYLDLPQWNYVCPIYCPFVLVAINLLLVLVGFMSVKQILKGTAADALRPYVPPKARKLLLERTKFWSKLSFGTKWNLRDVLRHFARTSMSFLGIVGCTTLIIGGLGMSDTLNKFISDYYEKAMNYNSRIYLVDGVASSKATEIANKYDGDWSASVYVEINGEKSVSLDVYSITNDTVRFLDDNYNIVPIDGSGAYVCRRIADEFNLKVGSTVTISPYQTDEKYTLKIVGIISSISESIVVSKDYADANSILYTIGSIYTQTEASQIETNSEIKTIQTKSEIMGSFDSMMELSTMCIIVLVVAALIMGVVVLYNLGTMSYAERYREMATLKVVGFKDGQIAKLLVSQNLWVTILGIIVGIPVGMAVVKVVILALASEYEMSWALSALSLIITIVLTVGLSLFVSLLVSRKNKKINMVEALKCAE